MGQIPPLLQPALTEIEIKQIFIGHCCYYKLLSLTFRGLVVDDSNFGFKKKSDLEKFGYLSLGGLIKLNIWNSRAWENMLIYELMTARWHTYK